MWYENGPYANYFNPYPNELSSGLTRKLATCLVIVFFLIRLSGRGAALAGMRLKNFLFGKFGLDCGLAPSGR